MARAVTLIRSASLSDIAEYAYAATAPAEARLIFLAGACPLNGDGSTAAVGDYAGQARKAVENMRTALADAGATLQDVISTRVLVASARREDLVTAPYSTRSGPTGAYFHRVQMACVAGRFGAEFRAGDRVIRIFTRVGGFDPMGAWTHPARKCP
ncbi:MULTISPECIES: RidA family protein [unclassified Streptomyces]|uniref:RidA family protein n=1 Tax=unclassified Streptomyces TaxID=2593676 RepID=UPI001F543C43|nr:MULTISPECIES: Rid family hydrolase [unclassified Streptomyces]